MFRKFQKNSVSAQDLLAWWWGQLASASPKGIQYNHEDWGKMFNYKLNNNYDTAYASVPDPNRVPTAPVHDPSPQKIVLTRPQTRSKRKLLPWQVGIGCTIVL